MEYVKNKLYEVFGENTLTDILIAHIEHDTFENVNILKYNDYRIYSCSIELCVEYIIYLLMKHIKTDYPKPEGKYFVTKPCFMKYTEGEGMCESDDICYFVTDHGNANIIRCDLESYVYYTYRKDSFTDYSEWLITLDDVMHYSKYVLNVKWK